ncbi:MAG: TetR family transcriptional regulator [Thermodesulfobacteriota bacterium]|nr:TetR family transcriptional regulator [Thermodesulfobacteriota bacterium]
MGKYQSSEKTRQALIDAAGELAAEDGIGFVTTRAIANHAKENIGSIHYHFGSKEKLLHAAVYSIIERWQAKPLSDILAHTDCGTVIGQAEAVRRVIERFVALLFDPAAPAWHSHLLYQVMQHANPLQETFRTLLLNPELDQTIMLIKTIDPSLDDETAQFYYFFMITPLLFHADYKNAVLTRMDKVEYDAQYLLKLTDLSIKKMLLLFNLPQTGKIDG